VSIGLEQENARFLRRWSWPSNRRWRTDQEPQRVPAIGKLVVCGVGLIGGSFALALRRAGQVGTIVASAVRRSRCNRRRPEGRRCHRARLGACLEGADFVLLATPVARWNP